MFPATVNRCERYALIGRSGRRWYRIARAVISRLADHHMTPSRDPITRIANAECTETAYRTLCDLVALTSPRCAVKRNLRLAWGEFTNKPRPADMIQSTHAALDHYYSTGKIRGPKTSRFARVLLGDDDCVVVDTWMARALGIPDRQARNKSTHMLGERIAWSVRARLSRATGIRWTLAETQAAIWTGCIRTFYKDGNIPLFRTADVGLHRTGPSGSLSDVPF